MAGSQITTIVANIATELDSVTGVQRVYKYELVALAPGSIPATMGSNQAIDFWIVRAELSRPRRLQGYQIEVDHTILFRHYYTVGDPSVTTPLLDTIILAVLDKFNNTFAIVPQAEMTGPPEIVWSVLWMLADTFLVHKTEIRLPIHELYVVQ